MPNPKIIVSSAAMLHYLAKIMEFLKEDAKLIVFEKELTIDGFKSMWVESQKDFETTISVEALRKLQKLLRSISEQPLTVTFDYNTIYVHSIII